MAENKLVVSGAVGVLAGSAAVGLAAPAALGLAVGSGAFLLSYLVFPDKSEKSSPAKPTQDRPHKSKQPKKPKQQKEESDNEEKPAKKDKKEDQPPPPEPKPAKTPKKEAKAAPAKLASPAPAPAPAPKAAQTPAAKAAAAPKPAPAQAPAKPAPQPAKKAAPAPAPAQLSKSQQKRQKQQQKKAAAAAEADEADEQHQREVQKKKTEEDDAKKKQALAEAAIQDKKDGWTTQTNVKKVAAASKPKKDKKDKPEIDLRANLIKIAVEPKAHSRLIGPQGSIKNKIEKVTGCKLTVPKPGGGQAVLIEGDPDNIEKAVAIINDLVKKGFSPLVMQQGEIQVDVDIPEGQEGRIIGAKGQYVKAIQAKVGVKIVLPDKKSDDRKIILVGTPAQCDRARDVIALLLNEGYHPITHEGQIKLEFEIPREDLTLLIGKGGAVIKNLQESTGAKVNIPDEYNPNQHVIVVGKPDEVARAEKAIIAIMEPPQEEEAPEEKNNNAWPEGLQEIQF